jgi:3-methyladenine DNA glycosylase AlkD
MPTLAEMIARMSAVPSPSTAPLRALRREFSRQLAKEPGEKVVALALGLLGHGGPGSRFVACELVNCHPAALASLTTKSLEAFGADLASWSDVDIFSCLLAGPAWREGKVSDRWIERWARSKDRWRRRAAVVATVPLNMKSLGGRGDTRRTLKICDLLADDRDDMVVKAVSWALRALSTRDPQAVRDFLEAEESRLTARVLREVRHKLTTGLKNPRRRG